MPSGINESRNRVCLSMFLDLNNDDHYKAWTIANSLKGERIFTPVIVDLLIMHSEFLSGDGTTFAEAYPAMHKLMSDTREGDLLKRIEGCKNLIDTYKAVDEDGWSVQITRLKNDIRRYKRQLEDFPLKRKRVTL